MFKTIATSPLIAKIQYCLKIVFIFIAVLFADALNHMLKVQNEGLAAKEGGVTRDIRSETDLRSRKFLSQRNFYLHGFTLFLSLILSRTYSLVLDLIKTQEDLAVLQSKVVGDGKTAGVADAQTKKQLADLQREYNDLSAKYARASGSVSNKKSD